MSKVMTPMQRFEMAVKVILEHEGKYSNDPNDPGGATMYGVSLRFLVGAQIDVNNDGEVNAKDIKALTILDAIEIYKKYWWDRYNYNHINDLRTATLIFDLAVNMGSMQAHKLVQEAVKEVMPECINLKVDGWMGVKTIAAINSVHSVGISDELRGQIKDNAVKFYIRLVNEKKKLRKYLKGWLNRINDEKIQQGWDGI